MSVVGLIISGVLLGLAAALAVLAQRARQVERRLARTESSLRRLRALHADAMALENVRGRFRRRQRGVERLVETSTHRMEGVHRSLASRLGWPAADKVYRRLRGLNRTLGRGVSGLFAPVAPSRRRESLARWRRRRADDDPHDDDR